MDSSQCHDDAPSGSQQFPCSMGRSLSEVAASLRSNLRRADRSNPENALALSPLSSCEISGPVVPVAEDHYCFVLSELTRYVKRTGSTCTDTERVVESA